VENDPKSCCGFVISEEDKEKLKPKDTCRLAVYCYICGYCERHCLEHFCLRPTIEKESHR
jgi:hypothetical protein